MNQWKASAELWFQHTAARRRLPTSMAYQIQMHQFQHTAARRRLPLQSMKTKQRLAVSTHSRAEAAA